MEIKVFKKIKKMLASDDEELIRLAYEILCHHEEDKDRIEMIVLAYINKKFIPDFTNGEIELHKNLFPFDTKGYNKSHISSKHPYDFNMSLSSYGSNIKPTYKVINLKNKNQQK
jgi:hypothetical protein